MRTEVNSGNTAAGDSELVPSALPVRGRRLAIDNPQLGAHSSTLSALPPDISAYSPAEQTVASQRCFDRLVIRGPAKPTCGHIFS